MKTIYETLDGSHFTDALDAEKHEKEILQQVKMWDRTKAPTNDTRNAYVINLIGKSAAKIFLNMVNNNPYEIADSGSCGIEEEDTGWFYWDDGTERYRWIDEDVINVLIAANH